VLSEPLQHLLLGIQRHLQSQQLALDGELEPGQWGDEEGGVISPDGDIEAEVVELAAFDSDEYFAGLLDCLGSHLFAEQEAEVVDVAGFDFARKGGLRVFVAGNQPGFDFEGEVLKSLVVVLHEVGLVVGQQQEKEESVGVGEILSPIPIDEQFPNIVDLIQENRVPCGPFDQPIGQLVNVAAVILLQMVQDLLLNADGFVELQEFLVESELEVLEETGFVEVVVGFGAEVFDDVVGDLVEEVVLAGEEEDGLEGVVEQHVLLLLELGEDLAQDATDVGHLLAAVVEIDAIYLLLAVLKGPQQLLLLGIPNLPVAPTRFAPLILLRVQSGLDQDDSTLDLLFPLLHAPAHSDMAHHYLSADREKRMQGLFVVAAVDELLEG